MHTLCSQTTANRKEMSNLKYRLDNRKDKSMKYNEQSKRMAERKGFEPSRQLYTAYSLSRGAPSTTRPPLRGREYLN